MCDDGINYSDYVIELVLLLFIKMVYENIEVEILDKYILFEGCCWIDLSSKLGINLFNDYKVILFVLFMGKCMIVVKVEKSGGEDKVEEVIVYEDLFISVIYVDV